MKLIRAFIALFLVPTDNPDLMLSQLRASSRQVPLLYFILVVNTVALGVTHYGVAPNVLTIGFPALVAVGCWLRVWAWTKIRDEEMSEAVVRRRLKNIRNHRQQYAHRPACAHAKIPALF